MQKALAAAEKAVKAAPSPDSWLGLAQVQFQLGRWEDGLGSCDRALALRDDAIGHNVKGWGYYRMGKLDDAEAELSKAVTRDDNFAAAHRNLGDVYYQKWLFPQALEQFTKAAALDGADAYARAMVGYSYYQLGDLTPSRKNLQRPRGRRAR